MSNRIQPIALSAATIACLSAGHFVSAGEIIGINPVLDPGIYSIASQGVIPGTLNNDNVLASDNQLFVLQKDYITVGYVDIVLDVRDSGGVTEYVVTENVQNSTVLDWTGYTVQLGFGTGGSFSLSTPGDGLDFDYDPVPANSYDSTVNFAPGAADFTTITRPNEDTIVASDGDLLAGEFSGVDFVFHIDVPDGITQFTLRQRPIPAGTAIPQPSVVAMTLVALAGGLGLRRRRNTK